MQKLKDRFLDLRPLKARDRTLDQLVELAPLKGPLLSSVYPEMYDHWLHELNYGYEPDDFNRGANWLVWWFCPEGPDHVYMQIIGTHFRALAGESKFQGCLFCAGYYGSVTNSLAAFHPDIASEWHSSKNKNLKPEDVSYGSGQKVWWKCSDCKHVWRSTISNRTLQGSGCPKCNFGEPTDLRDYPEVLQQFDHKKNRGINPNRLPVGQKVHWRCTKVKSHTWISGFYRTTSGERCPYCRGKFPSSTNNLSLRKDLASQFHPTRNGNLKPRQLSLTSNRILWWKCKKGPDHEWQARLNSRAKADGNCPFCLNHAVSVTNSLATVRPDIASQWHPTRNEPVTPDKVMVTSASAYWWKCPEGPDHQWQAVVQTRTSRGYGCPCCSNRKLSVTNSLANFPELLKEFDYKKNLPLVPDTTIAASHQKLWWTCSLCKRQWRTSARARAVEGKGCRVCSHKRKAQLSSDIPSMAASRSPCVGKV